MTATTTINSQKGITTISASILINVPKSKVWNVVKYPANIYQFHPLIKKSAMTTKALSGDNSKRICELKPAGKMLELISNWKEGEAYSTEVIGGKMLPPYKFMRGHLELTTTSDNTCKATFTFSYQLKFGLFGKVMDLLMIRPQFKKAPGKYVLGLKAFVENGCV